MLTLANMGLPMLVVHMPVLLAALLPIVVIEACWIGWRAGRPARRLLQPVLVANLVSTLVGVPLTWVAMVILVIIGGGGGYLKNWVLQVTVQSPWLIPDPSNMGWKVPVAALVLCPVFYAASAAIESRVLRGAMERLGIERRMGARWVWSANAVSYLLIAAYWVFTLERGGWGAGA